jgi:Tol biopolymer transport system component
MQLSKGSTWNESRAYRDAVTLRKIRQVTTTGLYNQTSNYHTKSGFTADGEYLVLATAREGDSTLLRCHIPTGDLTALITPLTGTGGYSEVSRGNYSFDGRGVDSNFCVAQRSGWVVYSVGRALRAVHLMTLEERTLIADVGVGWLSGRPSISPDESTVIIPVIPVHPEIRAGGKPTMDYKAYFGKYGGAHLRLLAVPLAGGDCTTVYEEVGIVSGHATFCPTDGNLILFDRDRQDKRSRTAEGEPNRMWTLRLSTGEQREMLPRNASRWQSHSVWSHDGAHIYYQGLAVGGGEYIGAMTPDGTVVREYHFAEAVTHQGHVSAMPFRNAILLDGHLTHDLLLWLYYDSEQPRLEVIARHGSQLGTLPGQLAHVHPQATPDGRFISFNAAHDGRADVYVVEV